MSLNCGINFTGVHISQAPKLVKYPVKVVFSDIDGTITNPKQEISEKSLSGIKQLGLENIPLILTTGRGYKTVKKQFLDFQMQPQTIITESGAVIVDNQQQKLYENKLSEKQVSKILDAFKEFKAPETYFRLSFDGDPYIEGSADAFAKSSVKTYSLKSFDELLSKGLLPTRAIIAKFNSASYEDINKLLAKFREILEGQGLNIFNSGTKFAEITNADVSKASAISFLQKLTGISLKNAASIGDAENDISMTKLISDNDGFSVSMGNGVDEMKYAAKFVTEDINNEGFYHFVSAILKINKSKAK